MATLFVGIDVSKNRLDVAFRPEGAAPALKVDNTPAGHRKLLDTLLKLARPADIRVGLESTGGLEVPVAVAFEEAGCEVAIIKPERIRYFALAHAQLAKTDPLDAAMIAEFVQGVKLVIHPLPSEELRQFRDLLDRRNQLVHMKTMERNRLGSTTQDRARASIDKHIAWIKKEIRLLDAELDERIAAHPKWKEIDRVIQSVPGLGEQVSRTIIGQLPELGRIDRKAIGPLVGLAPVAKQSGETDAPRHIVGGRRQVRNVLYMAALSATKHNPVGRDLYARLVAKGKSKKAALIAVAHKLLTIVNALVRDMQEWRHSDVAKNA